MINIFNVLIVGFLFCATYSFANASNYEYYKKLQHTSNDLTKNQIANIQSFCLNKLKSSDCINSRIFKILRDVDDGKKWIVFDLERIHDMEIVVYVDVNNNPLNVGVGVYYDVIQDIWKLQQLRLQ